MLRIVCLGLNFREWGRALRLSHLGIAWKGSDSTHARLRQRPNRVRNKFDFANGFKAILIFSPSRQKFCFRFSEKYAYLLTS